MLRAETMQLLEEAFEILEAPDVRNLFGADTAWDVIEDVLRRYFNEHVNVSPRNRMAIAGRTILRWLSEGYILKVTRAQFEALAQQIAEPAEEWITERTDDRRGSQGSGYNSHAGRPRARRKPRAVQLAHVPEKRALALDPTGGTVFR